MFSVFRFKCFNIEYYNIYLFLNFNSKLDVSIQYMKAKKVKLYLGQTMYAYGSVVKPKIKIK